MLGHMLGLDVVGSDDGKDLGCFDEYLLDCLMDVPAVVSLVGHSAESTVIQLVAMSIFIFSIHAELMSIIITDTNLTDTSFEGRIHVYC